jgi:hypothetical protein
LFVAKKCIYVDELYTTDKIGTKGQREKGRKGERHKVVVCFVT